MTYDSVLRAQRQIYHGLAARWLEQMAERNQRIDEYAALIAGHHDSSGDAVAAGRWYLRAARQASSVHALAEATRLLDRAVEVVPGDEPALLFDVLLAREGVFDRMGDRDASASRPRRAGRAGAAAGRPAPRPAAAAVGQLALPPQ